jgi:hypothetical protein
VKSKINLVLSGKDVSVAINVPETDMSLVARSKTFFLPVFMVSILTGNANINLSY